MKDIEVTWGTTDGKSLLFIARTEVDGRPYEYRKAFPTAGLRFALDRDAFIQQCARETGQEMMKDIASLQRVFESRGDDKNPLTGKRYGE